MKEDDQMILFDADPEWKKHWNDAGMPDFTQNDEHPVKQITVSFASEEDMLAFSELVKQTITMNTRSIWYPEAEIGRYANKRWVGTESENKAE